jgi:hypothetical protein
VWRVGCEPAQLRYVAFHGGLAEIAHLETPGHEWAIVFLTEADNFHRGIAVEQINHIAVFEVVSMPGKGQCLNGIEGFLKMIGHGVSYY